MCLRVLAIGAYSKNPQNVFKKTCVGPSQNTVKKEKKLTCDCKAFCVTRKGNNTDANNNNNNNNNNNEGMNAAFDRAKL